MNVIYSLLLLVKLAGISAASGLYYHQNQIYIVADNSPFLYHFDMELSKMDKILLDSTKSTERVDKQHKNDFESMYDLGSAFIVLESGSTPKRNTGFVFDKISKKVRKLRLDSLYEQMRVSGDVDQQNFNIEGVAYSKGIWYFLNRGNGSHHQNIVFTFQGDSVLNAQPGTLTARHISLPPINDCPSGFSDALVLGDQLFFLATGEDKASNYADGANKGTFIGSLDINSWRLGPVRKLSDTKKLEGLCLFKKSADKISFLICEDPDDDSINSSPVYSYTYSYIR